MLSAGCSRLAWLTRVGFSLFLVSATSGRLSASLGWAHSLVGGVFGRFPFTCGWAAISVLRAAREHAPCGVWLPGVVALVAYAVSGCPWGCAWLVRLRGFPCFSRVVLFAGAACVLVCARFALRMACGGVCVLRDLFLVGCFATCVAVCPLGCLLVGCSLPCRVLLVCCGLFCLSAIACCAFLERSRARV